MSKIFFLTRRSTSYDDWWKLIPILKILRPRQNGRHFPDDIFKWIFLNENVWILIEISLKFVPKGQINNIPVLVKMMALRRPVDKQLSEPIVVRLPTHICVTRPQWVKNIEAWITWPRFYRRRHQMHSRERKLLTSEVSLKFVPWGLECSC